MSLFVSGTRRRTFTLNACFLVLFFISPKGNLYYCDVLSSKSPAHVFFRFVSNAVSARAVMLWGFQLFFLFRTGSHDVLRCICHTHVGIFTQKDIFIVKCSSHSLLKSLQSTLFRQNVCVFVLFSYHLRLDASASLARTFVVFALIFVYLPLYLYCLRRGFYCAVRKHSTHSNVRM